MCRQYPKGREKPKGRQMRQAEGGLKIGKAGRCSLERFVWRRGKEDSYKGEEKEKVGYAEKASECT
jgi:hypothetical protein